MIQRRDQEEGPAFPAERPLQAGDRVQLVEQRGSLRVINSGQVIKRSPHGYIHVEWDDHSDGWFSPVRAAASLRLAEGEDALPRHIWSFDPPASLEEPVCSVCKAAQTDENEFGPCRG